MNLLYINSISKICGIYQWGLTEYNELQKSTKYNSFYMEPTSQQNLIAAIKKYNINVLLINYFPHLMPWLNIPELRIYIPKIRVVGFIHELTQDHIDSNKHSQFDLNISSDLTLKYNKRYKYLPRIVLKYDNLQKKDPKERFTIATVGFPFINKHLHKIIDAANEEFTEKVLIKMNLPIHPLDPNQCKNILNQLHQYPKKENIEVRITNDFLPTSGLIHFLASSDIACFFYNIEQESNGSSSIDLALSARVPIAVTNFRAFSTFTKVVPEMIYDKVTNNLLKISKRGIDILKPLYSKNTQEIFLSRIEDLLLNKYAHPTI